LVASKTRIVVLLAGLFVLLLICGIFALVVAGTDDTSYIQDIPVPRPRSDPTYQGLPASAWVKLMTDHDPDTSKHAMTALLYIGDGCVPHVEPVYRNGPDRQKASIVLLVLATEFKSQAALDAILRAAQSPDWMTRYFAVVNLGTAGPAASKALPLLEKMLNDPRPEVAKTAADMIRRVKGEVK
jgi:hypothetical protein